MYFTLAIQYLGNDDRTVRIDSARAYTLLKGTNQKLGLHFFVLLSLSLRHSTLSPSVCRRFARFVSVRGAHGG